MRYLTVGSFSIYKVSKATLCQQIVLSLKKFHGFFVVKRAWIREKYQIYATETGHCPVEAFEPKIAIKKKTVSPAIISEILNRRDGKSRSFFQPKYIVERLEIYQKY